MFYGEYIKHLTERSENGDEDTKESLNPINHLYKG